jgi:hypothetical protein
LFPGRGIPGIGDGSVGAGKVGEGAAASATGAASTDFDFGLAAGFAATGAEISTATSAGVSLVFAAAFLAGAFFGASSFGLASGNASRSFFATGGVMVDEPDFTNSPSSANFASATLESIPSSLAMSYTRGSAT